MTEPDRSRARETIWGISPQDRPWFQVMTLLGGVAGSVTLTVLELEYRAPDATPNTTGLNIVLGIGGSFVAAGFTAWGILQTKELAMSIAQLINDRRAKNRAKLIAEWYVQGYDDARNGRPPQMEPPDDNRRDQDASPVRAPRPRRRNLRRRP